MRFFKSLSEEDVSQIRKEEQQEYKTAHFMRIFSTVTLTGSALAIWFGSGKFPNFLITLIMLLAFYWVWYQLLPWIEQKHKKEKERLELSFITLLQKYVDTVAIENSIRIIDERISKIEEAFVQPPHEEE